MWINKIQKYAERVVPQIYMSNNKATDVPLFFFTNNNKNEFSGTERLPRRKPEVPKLNETSVFRYKYITREK